MEVKKKTKKKTGWHLNYQPVESLNSLVKLGHLGAVQDVVVAFALRGGQERSCIAAAACNRN